MLEFESTPYYGTTLEKTDGIYQNFLLVRARDSDCTNDGFACAYELASNTDAVDVASLPFKIDNTGYLSTTTILNKSETFVFNVRAYDCVSKDSYVETQVTVEIAESWVPKWVGNSRME